MYQERSTRLARATICALRVLTAGMLVWCGLWSANAQVEVAKGRRSFGVSGFSGDAAIAGQVTDVLKNDLRLSGYFLLAPASSAEFVQSGTVRGDRSGVVIE